MLSLRTLLHRRTLARHPSPSTQPACHFEALETRILLSTTFTPTTDLGGWRLDQGGHLLEGQRHIAFVDHDMDGQLDYETYGAVFADFDNDGDLDPYAYEGRQLWWNNGNGIFGAATSLLPNNQSKVSRGAAWGDFNGDAFVDLYIGGYEVWGVANYPDTLMLNQGGRSFTGRSVSWSRPTRGVTAADFDEDGDLDIYLSHYRLEPNALLVNDGHAKFTDQASSRGATGFSGHTIGSAWGDMDEDGHFDLFVGNFSHSGQPPAVFLRNTGPSNGYQFKEMGRLTGANWQESYASPALGDMDNDGDLDLLFTTVYRNDATQVYRNDGNWQFVNVTSQVGMAGLTGSGNYQAAWADVDDDGDLDLATHGYIYRNNLNNKNNHWLKVHLEGNAKTVNRAAIGAQVRAFVGDRIITRQVEAGTGEGNQNDLTLHFGLGQHSGNVLVEVTWPDGAVQTLTVATNQTLDIRQGATPIGTGHLELSAQVIAADATFVYWTRQSNLDGEPIPHELQYRKNNLSEPWSDGIVIEGTFATIDGLDLDTAYRARIRSLNGGQPGEWELVKNFFNTGSFNPSTQVIGEVGNLTDLTHEARNVTLNHTFKDPVVFAQSPSYKGGSPITVRVTDVDSNQFTIYLSEPSTDNGKHVAESISYLVMDAGIYDLIDGRRLEVGTVDTSATVGTASSDAWEAITYLTAFEQRPVVLTQIQTDTGAPYLHTRQNNESKIGFDVALQKEEAATDPNTTETVGYLAMKRGAGWSGLPMEAFTTPQEFTHDWNTLQFNQVYEDNPNFLSSLATSRRIDSANLRYRRLQVGQVDVKIREDTTADKETSHPKEKVSYLAIAGNGLILADTSNKPPTKPGFPSATVLDHDSALIEWGASNDPNLDPVTYEVQYRKADGGEPWGDGIATDKTSVTLTKLKDATTYDVRVQTDDSDLKSDWTQAENLFTTRPSTDNTMVIGEVGRLTDITHMAQTVTLNHSFNNPVVFAQSPSSHGGSPVTVRVTDVRPNRFTAYLAEPSTDNGQHTAETVSYLVLEAGSHELADRRLLEVGTVQTDATVGIGEADAWETVSYSTSFLAKPVVLSQIQTDAGANYLHTRQTEDTKTGFAVALQQEEATTNPHEPETVGYLAIERGAGWSGLPLESFTTSRDVTDAWHTVEFDQLYATVPNFLSSLASSESTDSANVRYRNLQAEQVDVRVSEDKSANPETTHKKERVSYLAIAGDGELLAKTRPMAPTEPTGLSASLIGSYTARLDWGGSMDLNADPITYNVQYRKHGPGESWSEVLTTTNTSLTLSALDADTIYKVRMRASDGELHSPWSQVTRLFRTTPAHDDPVFTAADLSALLGMLGTTDEDPAFIRDYDFDGNGAIDAADLARFLSYLNP